MGSQREKGNMRRACFILLLLLLLLLLTFSPTSGSKPAWTGLEIIDSIRIGEPGLWRIGTPNVGCSRCSKPKDISSTTGISQPSTDGIGNLMPSPCPTVWHCKRPSLKKQGKLVCCLRVERRGRFKCPNSCGKK